MRDGLARPVTRSQPDALNGVATNLLSSLFSTPAATPA